MCQKKPRGVFVGDEQLFKWKDLFNSGKFYNYLYEVKPEIVYSMEFKINFSISYRDAVSTVRKKPMLSIKLMDNSATKNG